MPDYKLGKIYKLTCDNPDLVYYGSTCQKYLSVRMQLHKTTGLKKNTNINSCSSSILFEHGNVNMELVENFPCENKQQLLERERYYIENFPCVNKSIPGRSKEEWKAENRDKMLEYCRKYNAENREKMLSKIQCECGAVVCAMSIKRHRRLQKHIKRMKELNLEDYKENV